eukprot:TRINITY_DN18792_c0_g1_i3.p1 TRINITY_DN18792_c0_g1~~TRINITY_DN18792_c0_g1_i3.p1  ORF type:complete len:167 (+),score=13.64 TRINITY_DN18792_c0_g1_i3:72-572(+)
MIRRTPRSKQGVSSAASDVYKRQPNGNGGNPVAYPWAKYLIDGKYIPSGNFNLIRCPGYVSSASDVNNTSVAYGARTRGASANDVEYIDRYVKGSFSQATCNPPEHKVLITDSITNPVAGKRAPVAYLNTGATYSNTATNNAIHLCHNARANALFAPGHVSPCTLR